MEVLIEIDFDPTSCCVCGVVFALPRVLHRALLTNGKTYWCPNGHQQCYPKQRKGK